MNEFSKMLIVHRGFAEEAKEGKMETRFAPRHSRGGIFLIGIILILAALFFLLFLPFFRNPSDRTGLLVMMATGPFWISLIVIAVIFLIGFYKMSYVISEKTLTLSCGFSRVEIPLSAIQSMRITNLKYHLSSTGFKIPGFSLFKVLYADEGWVRMCSRAVCKEILLLETTRGKFGLTPEDPQYFLRILSDRL